MAGFGEALKALRAQFGWRQVDLAAALENSVARSTLANIEAGREPPTPRVWTAICTHLPEWGVSLEADYRAARSEQTLRTRVRTADAPAHPEVAGSGQVALDLVRYVYNFGHSPSPEEIIEMRKVRALAPGVDGFDLMLAQTRHEGFRVDEECLWGGDVVDTEYQDDHGTTTYRRRVEFGKRLRLGQAHDFAVRSWVTADPEPDTSVAAVFTVPCRRLTFQLNFGGPVKPSRVWRYGPVSEGDVGAGAADLARTVSVSTAGSVAAEARRVEPGQEYGVGWSW